MTLIKRNQELPVFGDMLANIFEDNFFKDSLDRNGRRASVNIIENETEFFIEIEAAGLKKENFKIDLENNRLTITGKSETEETKKQYRLREFGAFNFSRQFTLPKNVNTDAISANYNAGILTVCVPKLEKEEEKKKQIEIA